MDKFYVEQYGQLEESHWWFLIRRQIIAQTIQRYVKKGNQERLQILNVGAATGASSKWLADFGDVVSIENDPMFLAHLAEKHIDVIHASVTDLPLEDSRFDLVCAFDVIEHVADDQKAMQELTRVCKINGNICITVPAFQSLWGSHDIVNGHHRRYTKQKLKDRITSLSATIVYSTYFNCLLFLPVFLFRRAAPLFQNKQQVPKADFGYFKNSPLINRLLKLIFGLEPSLLKWVNFPFGVSFLLLLQKAKAPGNRAQY